MLCGVLSKTPNLKEAVLEVKAAQEDPVNAIPALSHLERVVCHASWLRFLIPRRPITTAEVLCDPQVRVEELFEILHKGSVPLRDLILTYAIEWPHPTWSPDDLEPVARYLPELEILRLRIQDPKVAGLQQALFYISQLQKLRIVSFSFRKEHSRYDGGLLDDVWQELKLRELIGLTRSPFLERHVKSEFYKILTNIPALAMDRSLETDTVLTAQPWNSQTSEPGTSATYEGAITQEAGNDDARMQPLRTPEIGITTQSLPAEIWIAICDALRRLDLIDSIKQRESWGEELPELRRSTMNENRPDPVMTAVSVFRLSQTCRYLHEAALPSLLENIRLRPPSLSGNGMSGYLSVVQQVKSLQLNGNERLQHVKGFAVAFPGILKGEDTDYKRGLRNQICHLLIRLTNLRHLTFIGMGLDVPLMQIIVSLPLEHFWLWSSGINYPPAYHTSAVTAAPRIRLRSFVGQRQSWRDEGSIPATWMNQLIGPTMQDLVLDWSQLDSPNFPVVPDLEFLEVVAVTFGPRYVSPSRLSSVLSKMPNLKDAWFQLILTPENPSSTFPALPRLQRVTCHSFWLQFLIPGRSITTAEVLYDTQIPVEELCKILHEGSVPLRDLSLIYTYDRDRPQVAWSSDDLEPIARYLPELETLRLWTRDANVDSLQQAIFYVSQLGKLRLISFGFPADKRGISDDAWQEEKLREFLGRAKSPFLETITFVGKGEWRLEKGGAWKLWEGEKMLQSNANVTLVMSGIALRGVWKVVAVQSMVQHHVDIAHAPSYTNNIPPTHQRPLST
ncbi:hypothetical protein FRC00_003520 [Tulasnella sp. 408]|nr:hypothetical protein FRC00_003520 [Tulasnella sp. 408]